jgi:hypothetical protein
MKRKLFDELACFPNSFPELYAQVIGGIYENDSKLKRKINKYRKCVKFFIWAFGVEIILIIYLFFL